MNTKIKTLYMITVMTLLIGLTLAQPLDVPKMNGTLRITPEIKGNITTLHFFDQKTGKELFAKDVPTIKPSMINHTETTLPYVPTVTLPQTLPKSNTAIYIAAGIAILIFIAAVLWKFGKSEKEGGKQ